MSSNPTAPPSRTVPTRGSRVWRGALRAIGGLVVLGWSLLSVAWLTLHWVILPHIQQWRDSIETRAGQALGVPVRIGRIEVRSSGWVPSFELREVVLQGADGRPALRLPRVVAAVSARSLLAFELDFEQLLIEGAELDVTRDAAGRISVAGLQTSAPGGGGDNAAADWFFRQREFVIRGGAVRWTDALHAAPPLTLSGVDLVLRNGLREHALRLDATPPAAWGDRFSVTGRFTQPLLAHAGDWQRWRGSVYASLPRADVAELRRRVTLPFELSQGSGALRGWVDVRDGELHAATVDAALRDVRLRLSPDVAALHFAEVEGRFVGSRDANGGTLEAQRFGFLSGDGVRWPRGDLALAWRQRPGAAATGGSFRADRLDLGLVARIAAGVPIGASLHQLLDDARPQGVASRLVARWDGAVDAPAHYQVSGALTGLSLAGKASAEADDIGRPGVRHANLEFDATDGGGTAGVDIAGGALELPGVFEDPVLPLTRLGARLVWKIEAAAEGALPRISVQWKDVRLANADARVELEGRWSTGPGTGFARGGRYPGRLELDAKLVDGVATRVHRYLPLGLSQGVRDYVQRAVQGGRVTSASVRVRGDLRDFPFFDAPRVGDRTHRSEGDFRIVAQADDLTFAYVPGSPASGPGWPALTRASAELVLDRNTLDIRKGRARIGAVDWPRVSGRIQHLEADPTLALDATAHGPLAEMLRVVDDSPVAGWTGQALAAASATGDADLTLALGVPLDHPEQGSSVRGSLRLADNDVRMRPGTPLLGHARGRVDFTQQGFGVVGATARVVGGELAFQGGTQADGGIRFTGSGTATAEGLRGATEWGALARVATAFSGRTGYRVGLGFWPGSGGPEISVASNLVGLALNLPAPLDKRAETALAMRYQTGPEPATAVPHEGAAREAIQFDLGSVVQARYLLEAGAGTSRVLRGGIGVMDALPQSASGVTANVRLKTLDASAWQAVYERLVDAPAGTGTAGAALAGASAAGVTPAPVAGPDFSPDRVLLRVQQLDAGARRLTRLTANLSKDAGAWRANLEADQLAGSVEVGTPGAAPGGRIYARLSRLSLPKGEAEQVSNLLDAPPASVPALDVVVDDFELRGMRLGRVEILATNRAGGPLRSGPRDWQLQRLNVTTPEAEFVGTGLWAAGALPALPGAPPSPRRMTLDFRLQVADSGALLERLGTPKAIRGGKGQLSGHVAWLGAPFALDYPSLAGQVNVAIERGQFLKADPGAARLLGVLSLQSLPRRLSLDFRDVFEQGFAFDSVTGDLRIAQGVAQTQNLRMRGVQATVLMEGRADIEHETQDLRVVVVPEISAGTAALAYAAINPAIGLGAFLAQLVLRKPLMAAGTREFEVSGRWDDPKVEPVARQPAGAASAPASNR